MLSENFIPAQGKCLLLVDFRAGGQVAFPDYFAREFFDVDAIVLFVLRHFFGVIVVTVVSLDRHRGRVPGEEPGGDMNPRDVNREQTKTSIR